MRAPSTIQPELQTLLVVDAVRRWPQAQWRHQRTARKLSTITNFTTALRTSDYDFDLPTSLIAQTPLDRRDASRLMVLHRESGVIEHRVFADLPSLTKPGDLLVVNRSRVMRA